jgi:hypothetical protein
MAVILVRVQMFGTSHISALLEVAIDETTRFLEPAIPKLHSAIMIRYLPNSPGFAIN